MVDAEGIQMNWYEFVKMAEEKMKALGVDPGNVKMSVECSDSFYDCDVTSGGVSVSEYNGEMCLIIHGG